MRPFFSWRIIIRVSAVCLGISVIYAFLRLPQMVEFFRDQKSINILVWPVALNADYFGEFEAKTGIKIYITYFESYEELLVKLRAGGAHGYDLIMPSDYAADLFIKEGLLKKIDTSRLSFWSKIYPTLLGHYYDPDNIYTIPYAWEIYGLGIETAYFGGKLPRASWDLIFKESVAPPAIGMLDDVREIVLIAAQYLFGSIEDLDAKKIEQIKQLLFKQKPRVAVYTDMQADYLLLSQTVPVLLGLSSDISRAMRQRDTITFVVPEEGSFVLLDLFAIPVMSEKDELVYQFLNYLFQESVITKYANKFSFCLPIKTVASKGPCFSDMPTEDLFRKLSFFKNVVPEPLLNELWIALKA